MGLALPAPVQVQVQVPGGLHLPFTFINRRGSRVLISGHPEQSPEGGIAGPQGQVGADLTTAEAVGVAQRIALSVLANLKAEIGELSRLAGRVRVFGLVNSAPGYAEQHLVLNGFSDLILGVFGPYIGRHARSDIGCAGLPLNFDIEIEGDVLLRED